MPEAAQALINQSAALLPHVKITELLLEVDAWTGFTQHFTHLKTGSIAKDKALLLTTILADAHQPGADQNGRSLLQYDLCQVIVAASLAYPR